MGYFTYEIYYDGKLVDRATIQASDDEDAEFTVMDYAVNKLSWEPVEVEEEPND